MGMTIDEAIDFLEESKYSYEPPSSDTLDVAIETMHKYQKIEQIVAKRGYFIDDKYFLIKEVVLKNGNDD